MCSPPQEKYVKLSTGSASTTTPSTQFWMIYARTPCSLDPMCLDKASGGCYGACMRFLICILGLAALLAVSATAPAQAATAKTSAESLRTKLKKRTYDYSNRQCANREVRLENGYLYVQCHSVSVFSCHPDPTFGAILWSCNTEFVLVRHQAGGDRFQLWDTTVWYRKIDGIWRIQKPITWTHTGWRKGLPG